MPNRSSNETPWAKRGLGNRTKGEDRKKPPQEPDLNESAFSIVQQATGQVEKQPPKLPAVKKTLKEKNAAAVSLGRLGGLKGGKARAAKLTPEQRAEIAKKAAEKRWSTTSDQTE